MRERLHDDASKPLEDTKDVEVGDGVELHVGEPVVEVPPAPLQVDPMGHLPHQLLAPGRPALHWQD